MRYLLDTHTFLWFGLSDPRLSARGQALIVDPDNEILLSPASFWEVAIKISIGKYSLLEPYQPFVEREIATNGYRVLPIEVPHTAALLTMPFHHRDPFDRILIAQAQVENVSLISVDPAFDPYPITRIW
jgi:PIN domain nuclease of toxin-antitoxin system